MRFFEVLEKFLSDWWPAIWFILAVVLLIISIVVIIIDQPIREGLVMNKWVSEGYVLCAENGKCATEPTRWVVAVQNGEKKSYWLVSEDYYDSVSIGSWVKK